MHLLKCSIQKSQRSAPDFLSSSLILSNTIPEGTSGGIKVVFSPTTTSAICGLRTSQLWHLVGIMSVGTDLKSVPTPFQSSCFLKNPPPTPPRGKKNLPLPFFSSV